MPFCNFNADSANLRLIHCRQIPSFFYFRAEVLSTNRSKVRLSVHNTKQKPHLLVFIVERKYFRPTGQRYGQASLIISLLCQPVLHVLRGSLALSRARRLMTPRPSEPRNTSVASASTSFLKVMRARKPSTKASLSKRTKTNPDCEFYCSTIFSYRSRCSLSCVICLRRLM